MAPAARDTRGVLRKYPRTPHVEGSRPRSGDVDLAAVPFAEPATAPAGIPCRTR